MFLEDFLHEKQLVKAGRELPMRVHKALYNFRVILAKIDVVALLMPKRVEARRTIFCFHTTRCTGNRDIEWIHGPLRRLSKENKRCPGAGWVHLGNHSALQSG